MNYLKEEFIKSRYYLSLRKFLKKNI